MIRGNQDRTPWVLAGALALGALVLIGPSLLRAEDQQSGSSRGGRMMGHGMGPMRGEGGMCPMGGQMPVMPFPEDELPSPTSQGATAFKRYCMQCHALPSPRAHTAAEWDASLDRMVHRMRMMEREQAAPWGKWMPEVAAPSQDEFQVLRSYLKANALRPAPETLLPEQKGPGGERFSQVCSQCHALPDPALHTAEEWPDVVSRMHVNMQRMGVAPPEAQERAQILAFLIDHARP